MIKINKQILSLISVIFVLAVWTSITYFVEMNNLWFAGIDEVTNSIIHIFGNNFKEVTSTFKLITIASFITISLGIGLGLVVGFYKRIYNSLNWLLDFWRSIPPIVIIFILINLDSNTDYKWRIWLVIFGSLPIMIMQIADAIINISKKRFEAFNSAKPSSLFILKNIIVFEILPTVFSTTRTTISFAIIIVIVSEMIISPTYGIGQSIDSYQTAYEISYVYGYAIILGFIGVLLNKVLRFLEHKTISWQ